MKRRMMFLMLTLFVLSAVSANAQVIIGDGTGDKEPHAGAVLDLSPLGEKKLGLLIPNVTLGSQATDFVVVAGDVNSDVKLAATGMIVYNSAEVLFGAGLYVWTGELWEKLAVENL